MTNIREFIKKLGDKAPAFFDTKETTVARWLKTGSIPMKAVEKVMIAEEALRAVGTIEVTQDAPTQVPQPEPIRVVTEEAIDPLTKLPIGLDTRRPQIQPAPGFQPSVIEMNPAEQNWGVNLTRPGRINQGPLPPMKIKKVNGQDVPFVEQPKPVTVLPPELGNAEAGWSNAYEQPVKKESPKDVSPKAVS